eukprot:6180664-Pleurochrysis_carterae.AAC.1
MRVRSGLIGSFGVKDKTSAEYGEKALSLCDTGERTVSIIGSHYVLYALWTIVSQRHDCSATEIKPAYAAFA